MVELVFALLLIQDHKIVEHRIKSSLSDCLKSKRYALRIAGIKKFRALE